MYCLLCHAKIPRLRAWRTKSEFCSDEHAEAYKNQMLDRLMVNEPASAGTSDKRPLPMEGSGQPASALEAALLYDPAPPSRESPLAIDARSEPQRSGGLLSLGGSSSVTSRFESPSAPSLGSPPKERTAEQALAALRELAESAQRSGRQPRPIDLDLHPSEPVEAPSLRQPMEGGSDDPFDELRRLANLADTQDAEETSEGAEEEDLDVVARASGLERLMQEATLSQPDEPREAKLEELLRDEPESEQVSDLVSRLTEDAVRPLAELPAAMAPSAEEAPETALLAELADEAKQAEEVPAETLASPTGDAVAEKLGQLGEQLIQAAEVPAAVVPEPSTSEPSRGNVVPFPGEPREDAEKEDKPAAAGADTAVAASPVPSQDSARGKKRNGIPAPPAKVALEPLLDLFASGYRYPAQEDSQRGWKDFVARVQGDRISLKHVNGVIATQAALSYPAGPTPASFRSSADLDFALFSALPGVADPPSLDMERVDAEITGFEAACIHPELVFLNFALSVGQASGLADVSAAISRNAPSSGFSGLTWTGIEQQLPEPCCAPSVPANFLARCEDLSLSTDLDLFAGELVFAAASMSETSVFQPTSATVAAKLSGPRFGTAFPDRLFVDAGNMDEDRGQDWTAGDLVGAGLQGRYSSAAEFPPMKGTGHAPSAKDSLSGAGVFEPLFETKRPMDRDLSDYV